MQRRFAQVDVFGTAPFLGNPVAVVLDADGLGTAAMQRLAAWTNLSETTFVLPPSDPAADYAVRIFTTSGELPFAGHPTLGTCHAVLEARGELGRERVVQECGAGLVELRRLAARAGSTEAVLAFAGPPLRRSGPLEPDHLRRVAAQLGIDAGAVLDAAWVDNGPGWVGLLLAGADAVTALDPGPVTEMIGVAGLCAGGETALEVRAFCPSPGGWFEDPVTGSLNASLAEWLIGTGRLEAPYVAGQGRRLGRDGRIRVELVEGRVLVGGRTTTLVSGTVQV